MELNTKAKIEDFQKNNPDVNVHVIIDCVAFDKDGLEARPIENKVYATKFVVYTSVHFFHNVEHYGFKVSEFVDPVVTDNIADAYAKTIEHHKAYAFGDTPPRFLSTFLESKSDYSYAQKIQHIQI